MATILIVEDDPASLKLATVILRERGYTIVGAARAEEAEAAIARRVPDLIVMDMGLPGTDGYLLTRSLRERDLTREVPILALSAFAMKGDRERALAAGCTAYLTKPVHRLRMLDEVEALLSRPRGSA
jgi:CheY-like chemotaxis protein